MDRVRSKRQKHTEAADLDVTPFMNLMIVLVPVLLLSMVFTHTTVIDLNFPAGDAAAGEAKAAACAGCHGAAGEGVGEYPAIAGKGEAEFVAALQAFKSGEREEAMMQMFAGQLSDQDMADLAVYYAALGGD